MTKQEAKIRIEKLKQEINRYRYQYHVLDKQDISEAALDSLKHELAILEREYPEFITPDSPTQRVGGKALEKFAKVTHSRPVLSLEDVFAPEEIRDWEQRNYKLLRTAIKGYYCELKLDGLSVVLTYEDGKLMRGATRGDGYVGEDVTMNLRTIDSIPLVLHLEKIKNPPRVIEVRGEVVMTKKEFEKLNARQQERGLPLYANPRNIAAGSIRQLDPAVTAARKLDCFIFELITDLGQTTHHEAHELVGAMGFKTSSYNEYARTVDEVVRYLEKWEKKRHSLPYNTDGAVIVVNDIAQERALGSVGKADRWMAAYKFPAEQATTKVVDIIIQVGRTGALTPVAHLEPVRIAGTMVSRATLHNADEIQRLDIRIGDTVILQKAGDIIPEVVQVLTKLRTGSEKPFRFPRKCPMCGSATTRPAGEVAYYCTNKKCFAQQQESLIHFASKKGFDIEGMGDKTVPALIQAGLVKDASDFFSLTSGDVQQLEGFAEKSADNLVQAIDRSKKVSFPKFIFSLGIRHVGEGTARVLAQHFGTLEKLRRASQEELETIPEIGPIVAASVYAWFNQEENQNLLHKLLLAGVDITRPAARQRTTEISGKTFVLTGALREPRDRVAERIRAAGGVVTSSVSAKTDYVVAGDDPGSKYQKARDLGIAVINEAELAKLLAG